MSLSNQVSSEQESVKSPSNRANSSNKGAQNAGTTSNNNNNTNTLNINHSNNSNKRHSPNKPGQSNLNSSPSSPAHFSKPITDTNNQTSNSTPTPKDTAGLGSVLNPIPIDPHESNKDFTQGPKKHKKARRSHKKYKNNGNFNKTQNNHTANANYNENSSAKRQRMNPPTHPHSPPQPFHVPHHFYPPNSPPLQHTLPHFHPHSPPIRPNSPPAPQLPQFPHSILSPFDRTTPDLPLNPPTMFPQLPNEQFAPHNQMHKPPQHQPLPIPVNQYKQNRDFYHPNRPPSQIDYHNHNHNHNHTHVSTYPPSPVFPVSYSPQFHFAAPSPLPSPSYLPAYPPPGQYNGSVDHSYYTNPNSNTTTNSHDYPDNTSTEPNIHSPNYSPKPFHNNKARKLFNDAHQNQHNSKHNQRAKKGPKNKNNKNNMQQSRQNSTKKDNSRRDATWNQTTTESALDLVPNVPQGQPTSPNAPSEPVLSLASDPPSDTPLAITSENLSTPSNTTPQPADLLPACNTENKTLSTTAILVPTINFNNTIHPGNQFNDTSSNSSTDSVSLPRQPMPKKRKYGEAASLTGNLRAKYGPNTIYLSNLPQITGDALENQLRSIFSAFGNVTALQTIPHEKGRGTGYVTFDSHLAVETAMKEALTIKGCYFSMKDLDTGLVNTVLDPKFRHAIQVVTRELFVKLNHKENRHKVYRLDNVCYGLSVKGDGGKEQKASNVIRDAYGALSVYLGTQPFCNIFVVNNATKTITCNHELSLSHVEDMIKLM